MMYAFCFQLKTHKKEKSQTKTREKNKKIKTLYYNWPINKNFNSKNFISLGLKIIIEKKKCVPIIIYQKLNDVTWWEDNAKSKMMKKKIKKKKHTRYSFSWFFFLYNIMFMRDVRAWYWCMIFFPVSKLESYRHK